MYLEELIVGLYAFAFIAFNFLAIVVGNLMIVPAAIIDIFTVLAAIGIYIDYRREKARFKTKDFRGTTDFKKVGRKKRWKK